MGYQKDKSRAVGPVWLSVFALVVGIVTGFGAILFRALIAFVHNLFFLGIFSFHYDANLFTPVGPWGPFVILAPVIGGMGVVFLIRTFAPEARGHGVPEVMDAIYYREGRIRPVVAAIKSLASALSIGSGAAVGREGPIIQIGATFGSTLGQMLGLAPWQRITLVAAGAGAGIAATFNTPLGAVLFAIELMMPEISTRTFLPVAIATSAATYIGWLFLGLNPAFALPFGFPWEVNPSSLEALLAYVALGVLCGAAAAAFIRLLSWMEDFFPRLPGNDYTRHALGMGLVGTAMYLLMYFHGHYYIEGVGYATIQAILVGSLTSLGLLALLFAGKLFATTISLGSGASGGVFSPSLFMGATLGSAFGAAMTTLFPQAGFQVPVFAMVGMAAMVGGGTGAAMTAIIMIFEMTRDYQIIVPIIIGVTMAIWVRRLLTRDSIYTIKLVGRGHRIPETLQANMYLVRYATDIMSPDLLSLPPETRLGELIRRYGDESTAKYVLVVSDGRIRGLLKLDFTARKMASEDPDLPLGRIARRDFVLARDTDVMFDVLKRMERHGASTALVVRSRSRVPRSDSALGVIGREQIVDTVLEGIRVNGN